MLANKNGVIAAVIFAGLTLTTVARADDCDRIDQFLQSEDAHGYVITPITNDYVGRTFPGRTFCAVIFQQWPVAVYPPEGLEESNVGVLVRDQIRFVTSVDDLRGFFSEQLGLVPDPDAEQDAGRTWLRLSEELK